MASSWKSWFRPFREQIIGIEQTITTPYGEMPLLYADWTASGRAYAPIENRLVNELMPLIANTHTETTATGRAMTLAYEEARQIIKRHVGANGDDVLLFAGSGMTGAVNKFQRLLGLRIPERVMDYVKPGTLPSLGHAAKRLGSVRIHDIFSTFLNLDPANKPLVLVSQMEHHSNQTSWLETIADVEIVPNNEYGNIDLGALESLLIRHKSRPNKMAAVTACSNVTGIRTPYHSVARVMHKYGGLCFVDFACSAPYVSINMHPPDKDARLDAIYFSPHKFLGGQGTPGILVFNRELYHNLVPDQPGGGTVSYTNPWKYHEYLTDIEHREDGGTPPFLQAIKAGMAVRLKEAMGVENLLARERELSSRLIGRLRAVPGIQLLEAEQEHRLAVISIIPGHLHYNLFVKLLNDRFGIQVRGGCACAGTYGHALLHVDEWQSYAILDEIHRGHLFCKPGWVRISLHPVMTDEEIDRIADAVELVMKHAEAWAGDYIYDEGSNEFRHKSFDDPLEEKVKSWFNWKRDAVVLAG